jgi:DNA-binding NarL/FixJ family response regulator
MGEIRALLVDDHDSVRDAVTGVLLDSKVVAEVDGARSLQEAQQMLARNADYDIVVLDLKLEDANGLAALNSLRESFPDVPVLVFSSTDSNDTIHFALGTGAKGYVPKAEGMEVLLNAVRLVLAGSYYVPPRPGLTLPKFVGARPVPPSASGLPQLSPRQADVLRLLLLALPIKVIASRLGMAEGTVKAHLNAIYGVLQVHSRSQAILRAREFGMI